jgi:hypothetical protein
MAKKQKRSVSTTTVRTAPVAAPNGNGSRPVYTPMAASRTSYSQEFNPDYSVVISDLKRIGIMAGTGVVVLVVLSFFLH